MARLTARPKLVIPFAELSSFELRSFSRIPRAIRRPLSCKGGFLHGQICTISGLGTPLLTKTDEFSENFQRGGGGVRCHLEVFQKFIHFGEERCPLAAPLTLVIQFTAVSQLPLLNLVIENPQNDQQPLNCQEFIFEI